MTMLVYKGFIELELLTHCGDKTVQLSFDPDLDVDTEGREVSLRFYALIHVAAPCATLPGCKAFLIRESPMLGGSFE